jgi:hypothetical protein
MGAWDAGSFDNDDALDWVNDFSDEPSRKFIESTLKTVTNIGDEYLEAPESSMAIAAAEAVAALQDTPHPKLPEELKEVLASSKIMVDQNLIDLAHKALERVKTNSELKDLWEEGDASEWLAAIADLEERLES